MIDLPLIWYFVLCAAVIFYAILDGFDLGVGSLYLFFRKDQERRILLNSIGPVWDGNEVWLVVVLGALLAGFTPVYATLLTGFYTPTMILIFFLIFRAVAIEFRSKLPSPYWRSSWDCAFAFSSLAMAFVLGTGVGNLILGVPLTDDLVFVGSLSLFFRSDALLVGVCAVSLFTMHGSAYLCMKTEGTLQNKMRRFALAAVALFFVIYSLTTIDVLQKAPWMLAPFFRYPPLFILPVCALCAICFVPYCLYRRSFGYAFVYSSLSIALLLSLFGIGMFPYLLRSSRALEHSLTIYNAASSEKTLQILLTVACIGLPLMFVYVYWVYRIFRGKVRLDKQSY